MSYRLFLDDIRMPVDVGNYINPVELRQEYRLHEWVIVRNYIDFVREIIANGLPTHVSFDHDLVKEHYNEIGFYENIHDYYLIQDREPTGWDCGQWLISYCKRHGQPLPMIYVHSTSIQGKPAIKQLFAKAILLNGWND